MRKNIKYKVLFLCTSNSCRSQMAEAIINAHYNGQWIAYSAGVDPIGYIHPIAIQVLNEIGIAHNGRSKSVEEFQNTSLDLVISVCDAAAEECPLWLGQGRHIHAGFPDPAKVTGNPEEILNAFRSVRDEIILKIPPILKQYEKYLLENETSKTHEA